MSTASTTPLQASHTNQEFGHTSTTPNTTATKPPKVCNSCKKPGHTKHNCPEATCSVCSLKHNVNMCALKPPKGHNAVPQHLIDEYEKLKAKKKDLHDENHHIHLQIMANKEKIAATNAKLKALGDASMLHEPHLLAHQPRPASGCSKIAAINAQVSTSKVVHQNAADSYGAVAKQQAATGTKSDTLLTPFRNYNNYVKKALVQRSMSLLLEPETVSSAMTTTTTSSSAATSLEANNTVSISITSPTAATAKKNGNTDSLITIRVPANSHDQCLHRRLLTEFISAEKQEGRGSKVVDGFSVLDIASGRGGDLQKWLYGQHPAVSAFSKCRDSSSSPPLFIKNEGAVEGLSGDKVATLPEQQQQQRWICNTPKDRPVYVSNVISVDISPGAVEEGLNRFNTILSVDVAPGTKIHDSMIKNLREGRELPPAQFFVSNCLSPNFWKPVATTKCTTDKLPVASITSSETAGDNRLRQVTPDQCDTISCVRQRTATLRAPPMSSTERGCDGEEKSCEVSFLSSALPSSTFPVDIISVQFAFHYACETEESMQANLAGMHAALVTGKSLTSSPPPPVGVPVGEVRGIIPRGVLVLTTVDAVAITQRLQSAYRQQKSTSGNGIKSVTYTSQLFSLVLPIVNEEIENVLNAEESSPTLPLGTRYHFKLDGHVDCDEFVVPYDDLVQAATTTSTKVPVTALSDAIAESITTSPFSTSAFTLLESHSFVDSNKYLHEFNTTPKYKRQMDGKSLEEGDLDLIGIYRTYVFGAY